MARATVGRWDGNLAVRLPREVVEASGLSDGERVEIESHDGDILIRRAARPLSAEELFAGRSPEEWRAEYGESSAELWPDAGREIVEE